ncbi:MAG TPA: 4-hydroxy-tetrahydrodipicolinate reductase, partial [Myxococcota bacterium]|nr:4-hydroxy-tetrahydrodipicolinate reductase [Myxococcota bacterium]
MTYIPGVVVVGAKGRMGQRICALLEAQGDQVAASVDKDGPPLDEALGVATRCVIDFSSVEQVERTLSFCVAHKAPLVLGTTGLTPALEEAINRASQHTAIVAAPNFSVGVHVLLTLVSEAARLLDEGWDAELVEAHHRHKVDAPSGTAMALAQRVAAARRAGLPEIARYGRVGQVGARPRGELGIHAVRGGSVVGDHTLSFFAEGEVL